MQPKLYLQGYLCLKIYINDTLNIFNKSCFMIKNNVLKYPYFVSILLIFLVYCFSIWTEEKNPVCVQNEMKLLSPNHFTDYLTTRLTVYNLAY